MGSRLGLSTVFGIVGSGIVGPLQLQNVPEGGAMFVITFPVP